MPVFAPLKSLPPLSSQVMSTFSFLEGLLLTGL